jgi:flagellar biosynthetic protein FliR
METLFQPVLTKALLIGARVGMMMVFVPFFGSGAIPRQLKAGVTVALTAFLYPIVDFQAPRLGSAGWTHTLAAEAAIGMLIGLVLQFVFEAVETAGQIFGFQLGLSLENIIDPQTQADTPLLSLFCQYVAILIFFALGIHLWMLHALADSFQYLPLGAEVATPVVTSALMREAATMIVVGVQIAAPVLLATIMTDVALGFIGRAAPQLPVMLVGISLKDLVGLGVLAFSIMLWPGQLQGHFEHAFGMLQSLLHQVH